MRRKTWLVLALAWPLQACGSDDEFLDNAVNQARAQCAAQGGQFHMNEQPKVDAGDLMDRDVEFEAACLQPGEPGYVPPKK